jgi:CRP-like cAMP-binding protein
MTQSPHFSNSVLASLRAVDFAVLQPHLKVIDLPQETILFEAGDLINQVYFPHIGVVSLVVELASGDIIEVAMIGRDSLVGASAVLDGPTSLCKAIVQIAGVASIIDVDRLRDFAEKNPAFRSTLANHERLVLAQAQQSAACNATHSVEARLSRWLLRSRDLQGNDKLRLTQEFLAQMLGVRRSSVSVVANALQQAGLIRYSRGHIDILDLSGLRITACECYATVKSQSDLLLGFAEASLKQA